MGIVLLTGVRLTHPLMAAPARARQGQLEAVSAPDRGKPAWAGWRGQANGPKGRANSGLRKPGCGRLAAGPGPLSHGFRP